VVSGNPYADPQLLERVLARLVGREREARAVLAALAAGRNVLLQGPPGTSKSTLLRAIAEEAGALFFLVEGSADLTPQKLVGTFNPAKVVAEGFKPEFFEPGPLVQAMQSGGLLYIEEFNRMPEEAMNALIRAAEDREIAVPRLGVIRARESFRIVCAMNPYDDVGTSRVSRALLDRFVMLRVDYQSREEEIEIVLHRTGSRTRWLVELAVDAARATRRHPAVRMGASVRGAIDMVLIAEQLAGGKPPTFDDLKLAAVMALSPKIWLKDASRKPEDIVEEVLRELLEKGSYSWAGEGESGAERVEEGSGGGGNGDDPARELVELSETAPRKAALVAASDPSLLGELAKAGLKGLDAIARFYGYLPSWGKDRARAYARDLVVELARGYAGRRKLARGGRLEDAVDIDVDGTVERVLDACCAKHVEPAFFSMRKKGRAYALVVDRSSSMAGFKLVLGSLASAMLAYAGSGIDDYCVLAFNTEVDVVKRIGERRDVEDVVDAVLSLDAKGYTDIHKALLAARSELLSAGYEPRAVLVTDAEWTAGENPLLAAPLFRELNVVCVPTKWLGFAKMLAEAGGGHLIFARSLEEAFEKLRNLLVQS